MHSRNNFFGKAAAISATGPICRPGTQCDGVVRPPPSVNPPKSSQRFTHQHKQSSLLSHPKCLLQQARTGRSIQRTSRTMSSQKRRSRLSRMSKKLVRANSTQFLIYFQGYTSSKDLRSGSLRRRVTDARKANQREANKRQRENWSQGTLQTTG